MTSSGTCCALLIAIGVLVLTVGIVLAIVLPVMLHYKLGSQRILLMIPPTDRRATNEPNNWNSDQPTGWQMSSEPAGLVTPQPPSSGTPMCIPGFELTSDNRSCVDVNECLDPSICGESAVCFNTVGAYLCNCTNSSLVFRYEDQSCLFVLTVRNGIKIGDWGPWKFCPSYASVTAMQVKFQEYTSLFVDNVGLTGVRFSCFSGSTNVLDIDSTVAQGGLWEPVVNCTNDTLADQNYAATGFTFSVQPYSPYQDNLAVDMILLFCRSPKGLLIGYPPSPDSPAQFGRVAAHCPDNGVLCGMQTRVFDPVPSQIDHMGITDIRFACCDLVMVAPSF